MTRKEEPMPETNDLPQALLNVGESMARAAWTFVRIGAQLQAAMFGKIRDMAEGALEKLGRDNRR